ncbi:hypothetical protein RRG08_023656 [Elysia crispata]|uniref:Uncharacterized protein n=1 Tax=Elysia crispata TaxID=231223 RepID=A0AAE0XTT3_9GAST|nr:hypothetical protein RRG08_023656 [Elysia crispata]
MKHNSYLATKVPTAYICPKLTTGEYHVSLLRFESHGTVDKSCPRNVGSLRAVHQHSELPLSVSDVHRQSYTVQETVGSGQVAVVSQCKVFYVHPIAVKIYTPYEGAGIQDVFGSHAMTSPMTLRGVRSIDSGVSDMWSGELLEYQTFTPFKP